MDVFLSCSKANELLSQKDESGAREEVIKLLDHYTSENKHYDHLLNHLVRQVGLYPYMKLGSALWHDRVAYESFKVDIGEYNPVTLHREQSTILRRLLSGSNLAVSAPTSFGKSFIIDAFISIKKPKNVMIIVPTIALADETRRRLNRKFANDYKIITTSEVEVAEKNIFIFPQERSIHYLGKIDSLDMLVVDEFYKASPKFDTKRSTSLLKAIAKLGKIAKQKYFIAPNITAIKNNVFTKDMEFVSIDFNTVYLKKHNLFESINGDEIVKGKVLLDTLNSTSDKTLIYAGTYADIDRVANLVTTGMKDYASPRLNAFKKWLEKNYDPKGSWFLSNLISKGCGIHTGKLHRSLGQIQIRMFEEKDGLKNIISTSSIVEGINTSAKNIVVWRSKNGTSKLNDFTFKNIIGRGGRMFKYFVGEIFILEQPPVTTDNQLDLTIPEALLDGSIEEEYKRELTPDQLAKIIAYKEEMNLLMGDGVFSKLQSDGAFENSDSLLLRKIAKEIASNQTDWNGLGYLNSNNSAQWDTMLYKVLRLNGGAWETSYKNVVEFVKVLSNNWDKTIPELISELDNPELNLNEFFKLERIVTFTLSALLSDVNILQKNIFKNRNIDISPFIAKVSHAFLPPVVYQLEEYGLPRMISKKLHRANLINFKDEKLRIHDAINFINLYTYDGILCKVPDLDEFDKYVLKYFFDGISVTKLKK